MITVHMNGLTLIPGIDYTVGDGTLTFSSPPPSGYNIMFSEAFETGTTHVTHLTGDGYTYLFKLDTNINDRARLYKMFDDAMAYKDIPAVHDALNQLRVIVELVKDDHAIHQR